MKLIELFEGLMKRSQPHISGDRSVAYEPTPARTKKYDTKILNLASKSGKTPAEVERVWFQMKHDVDLSLPNAYAIVMSRTKKALGL